MGYEKIKQYIKFLWNWKFAIIGSFYFNLKHLPFSQAIKLPIWLNKPHIHKLKGEVIIDAPIKPGMIKLGGWGGHIYPNNGINITQEKKLK